MFMSIEIELHLKFIITLSGLIQLNLEEKGLTITALEQMLLNELYFIVSF